MSGKIKPSLLESLSKVDVGLLRKYAYLDLNPYEFIDVHNILLDAKERAQFDNPIYELVDLMSKPENFAATCKWILNIDLLPFQGVILEELWKRKFPMLIGSRGLSKCITGDSFIMLNDGIYRIEDIIDQDVDENIPISINKKAYGENGFQQIEYGWKNTTTDNIAIKTRHGFSICGTKDHRIRVVNNGEIIWKELQDLKIGDYIPIDRTPDWFDQTNNLTEDEAYLLGVSLKHKTNCNFPSIILKSKKRVVASFINGLLDFHPNNNIVFIHQSKDFVRILHILLAKFGIIAYFVEQNDYFKLIINNLDYFIEYIIKKRDYINNDYFYDPIVDISQSQNITYDIHIPNDHSFISNGIISHNTFLLSLYSLLRALFTPNSRIIFAGAAFRQSKLLFEYVEQFWRNSPILRNIVGDGHMQGPKHGTDRYSFYIGSSVIHAIPIGDGEKIRGLRGNFTITDEFSCLERNTLIQTNLGLIKIEDMLKFDAETLLNKNKEFEFPSHIIKTPPTDVYKIVTCNGYTFKCSSIHKVMTIDGWKLAKDLTNKDVLELDTNDYFPSDYIQKNGIIVDEKLGWILGLLVSEGTNTTRNNIVITNTDKNLINHIIDIFPNFDWKIYTRKAMHDSRGWDCKESYCIKYNNTKLRTTLYELGLDYVTSHQKEIPWCILQSPRSVVIEFLKGLYEGDGSGFQYISKGKKHIGISYYSVSETLIDQLQVLLLKFNILPSKTTRKTKLSQNTQFSLSCRAKYACNLYHLLQLDKWKNLIVDVSFFERKPTIIKRDNRFILQTTRGNKNKHLGVFDTEEECIKKFEDFWQKANQCIKIKSIEILPEKEVLYDFYLPQTHSFRGNGFIHHNSIPREVFEVVIRGFGAVHLDPVKRVQNINEIKLLKGLGLEDEATQLENNDDFGNQIVISGTAYYTFNHFYEYWKKYKAIIESKGDNDKLQEVFQGQVPPNFDWRQYSVIRIPYDILPKGLMDENSISQAQAMMHSEQHKMEFSAVFSGDSNGFFKRSLIEACVTTQPISTQSGDVQFRASVHGSPNKKYVFGIDPASEQDNFAITVLELEPDHRRIVYCWTINRKKMRERLKGKTNEASDKSFYNYCAKKIRDLTKVFPTDHIGIDKQGGGIAIIEALHDISELGPNDQKMWPYVLQGKHDPFWWEVENKPTDAEQGLHNLHVVQFANSQFNEECYHSLKKDLEMRTILFPMFDSVELGLSLEQDNLAGRDYDTLEDCVLEIEELKNELTTIVHTQTITGRDKWDTPEIKEPGGRKGRLRKDRVSSLLIANQIARLIDVKIGQITYIPVGGYIGQKPKAKTGQLYYGPDHIISKMTGVYGTSVQRNKQ